MLAHLNPDLADMLKAKTVGVAVNQRWLRMTRGRGFLSVTR
jgi:hypothetical protein